MKSAIYDALLTCELTGVSDARATGVRKLAVRSLWKGSIDNGIHRSQWWGEVSILRRLKHDNLIELVDEFEDEHLHCIVLPRYTVSTAQLQQQQLA